LGRLLKPLKLLLNGRTTMSAQSKNIYETHNYLFIANKLVMQTVIIDFPAIYEMANVK
jgi:hypothetical protein